MIQEKAKERVRILAFWERHGTAATEEAFKVKKRTLYRWQKKLKEGLGKLEALNDGNRAPKKKRKRLWDYRILEELRRLRNEHPNLGKEKLYPLLLPFCRALRLSCPKPRTLGRLVKDCGGLRIYPQRVTGTGRIVKANRQKVLRKPKEFKTTHTGHLVALDTIERFIFGVRRYIITFEDIHTRFGFAWATSSHASLAAKEFFDLCRTVFPHPIDFVLTDNGSEFKKHFAAELKRLHLVHYHTYPKTPKQNAHCERFNRTVQEEFVDFHANLLLDTESFNRKLMDYLAFYNTERVHFAFGNKLSPVAFMLLLPRYQLIGGRECKTGWPYTFAGKKRGLGVYFPPMVLPTNILLIVFTVCMVIAVFLGIHTEWRVNRLLRGKKGKTLEEVIIRNADDIEKFKEFRKELETYLETVEKRLDQSVRGVSTVRFNPFKGTGGGGNQSFAAAFLDEKENGIVLSTLYARERVGIYAKPIKNGKSEYELTGEEREAIKLAKQKLRE